VHGLEIFVVRIAAGQVVGPQIVDRPERDQPLEIGSARRLFRLRVEYRFLGQP
jgi:hypothetical protein